MMQIIDNQDSTVMVFTSVRARIIKVLYSIKKIKCRKIKELQSSRNKKE